ncbi:MAG TPA: hypothetical protein VGL86_11700 [Polyangia bacterium]
MPLRAAVPIFALVVASCAGPTQAPTTRPPFGGSGGNGGSGGDGSGGNGATTPMPTPTPTPDGGTTTQGVGCSEYVACLTGANSDATESACDAQASAHAKTLLDALDACVLDYCEGKTNAAIRCQADATGNPENLDGSPAFDSRGLSTGDCGDCLDNGEAALWSEPCEPSDDPACNTSACAQFSATCHADM